MVATECKSLGETAVAQRAYPSAASTHATVRIAQSVSDKRAVAAPEVRPSRHRLHGPGREKPHEQTHRECDDEDHEQERRLESHYAPEGPPRQGG